MTKYQEYLKLMYDQNKAIFDNFDQVHARYALHQERNQEEFNTQGKEILKLIIEYENKLCAHSEKAGYGGYTGGLAEKFRTEIKKRFPMIDYIGIKAMKAAPSENNFFIKKINY